MTAEHSIAQRLLALLRFSSDVILTVTPDLTVTYASPAVEHALGLSPDDLVGRCILGCIHPEDVEPMRMQLGRVIDRPGAVARADLRMRHADGSFVPFETVAASRLGDSTIEALVVSARNVADRQRAEHERRQMEQQLWQAQKMEAVGRLAGGVAHDFNNLLTVILNYAQCIQAAVAPGHPVAKDVNQILEAARRGGELTRQLLTFSHPPLRQPAVVDLNHTIRDVARMLTRLLGEHVELKLQLTERAAPVVMDPSHASQVLINLMVNARDAMPSGGTLTIATREIVVERLASDDAAAPAPGCYVVLTVSDTGIGMSDDVKERIFEPFYTTKPASQGSGLGLATVYGMVQQAHGTVRVSSAVGQGSSFELVLPCSTAARVETSPGVLSSAQPVPTTVLLAEDDAAVRRATRQTLERSGFAVLEADDGLRALAMVEEDPRGVDLVLSDVVMPHLGGRELAAALRRVRPELPVVLMTGHGATSTGAPVDAAGEVTVLSKPFTVEELVSHLRRALHARASR